MSDRWIVSDHNYHNHFTLDSAEREKSRLSGLHPEKSFRIYRIKGSLERSKSKRIIADLLNENAILRKTVERLALAAIPLDEIVRSKPSPTSEGDKKMLEESLANFDVALRKAGAVAAKYDRRASIQVAPCITHS